MINRIFVFLFPLALVACSAAPRNTNNFIGGGEVINAKGDRNGIAGEEVDNWFTKDRELDQTEGVSSDRAYNELALKVASNPIIVAVIDSGVDVTHEDLQGLIWTNPGEKPGNGIDDDRNGYVDDIHGWNFLGTRDADGNIVNVEHTTLEVTRESVRLKKLKAAREAQGQTLTEAEQQALTEASKKVEENYEPVRMGLIRWSAIDSQLRAQYEILKNAIQIKYEDLTPTNLKAFQTDDLSLIAARDKMVAILSSNFLFSVEAVAARLNFYKKTSYLYDESFDPRLDLMHDDYLQIGDRYYGNNDVKGPDARHGTHVAGIIAANRRNNLGIVGIATDVRIMAIRAVPDGDEYDKDVANSVRYAVDNGARIINMSFGKAYSPLKGYVDEAFKYAASKGVLIVHAAGNDSQNNDVAKHFPNRTALNGVEIPGWLEVGASSHKANEKLPASFSNYGKRAVDLFAPGHNVKSTTPGNKYASFSGTSMACPSAAGVAALVLSQRPDLEAVQLKELLMNTARTVGNLAVSLPQEGFKIAPIVRFDSLSVTGAIANAYDALRAILPTVH